MADKTHVAADAPPAIAPAESPSTPRATVADRVHAVERRELRAMHLVAAIFFLGGLTFAAIGWWQRDVFFLRLGTESLLYAGLALSVDILLGHAGLLSLGQALFFGLGAYVSALVLKDVAASFWLAIAASLATGVLAGLIGGVIAIRAKGVYFALITFGLAQVVAKIIYNTRALGASDGIIGIPIVEVPLGFVSIPASNPAGFFLIVLAIIGIAYLLAAYLTDTPFGRVLSAIRANQDRLPFLGIQPGLFKLGAFVLSAAIAGVAGGLYPILRGFVSPELLYFEVSTNAVIAVIVGGTGTLVGPLYGAVILSFGKSIIGTYTEHHLIVIGALFVASVIFLPSGLIGFLRPQLVRLLGRGKGGGSPGA